MTTPNNEELQRLLDTAKPGDWQFQDHEEWEHVAGPEYPPQQVMIAHAVEVDGAPLFWNSNDDVLVDYPGNLRIAALAPVLAAEVIRLREENERMQERVNKHVQETAPTIIHTVEELEALALDTVLSAFREDGTDCVFRAWDVWQCEVKAEFPAVVVATAAHVRAALKALEEA